MKNFNINAFRVSIIALVIFFSALQSAFGQSGVVISRLPGTADPSALLDIVSDGNPSWKGVLIPRMTAADRTGISTPATGLLVFQLDGTPGFYYNAGTPGAPNWVVLSAGAISGVGLTNQVARWTTPSILGTGVLYDNGVNVGVGIAAPNEKFEVSGAIKFGNTASVCDATSRGTTKFVPGGSGARDCLYQCMKLADDTYAWTVIKCPGVNATGGTITNVGTFRIHTFTSSGTFTITDGGNVQVLVVAGGGAGGGNGSGNNIAGGGGGGGGVISNTSYAVVAGQIITVTVGAGGVGTTGNPTSGGNSVFGTITATGGGSGGGWNGGAYYAAASGGSGGGGIYSQTNGAVGTAGQGNGGGNGLTAVFYPAGGGGGAGGAGQSFPNNNAGGNGGVGLASSISGSSVFYGGGGGGGLGYQGNSGVFGIGGSGGGGNGSSTSTGQNGAANTGGGGGGAGNNIGAPYSNAPGGNGGSGIVIVRYSF